MNETFHAAPPHKTPGLRLGRIVTLVLLLLVCFSLGNNLYAVANMQYHVTPTTLRIRSGFRTEEIPLDQVSRVWLLESPTKAVRVLGTSTAGLKTGHWRFAETSDITLYATQLDALTVIEAGGKRWGLSPENPDELMQAIESRTTGTFLPGGGSTGRVISTVVLSVIVLAAVVATIYVVAVLGRFAKGLQYEVGPDGVIIRSGWRPIRIRYDELEEVKLAHPYGRPLRIVGTSVGGLRLGRFRWPAVGPNLRLYTTRHSPLVVLQLKDGRTYGITPTEGERFVEVVQKKMR